MRIVALEEHVVLPDMVRKPAQGVLASSQAQSPPTPLDRALADVGADRIRSMDEAGITCQVLSVVGSGAEALEGDAAITFARRYNDHLAQAQTTYPTRFAAFSHLPMRAPEAAADELERCVTEHGFRGALVNGTTAGLFLDDPRFDPILARACALDCPIYIHPAPPPPAVRNAYYGDLPSDAGALLATAGFGWHSETAIHILRLVLSRTLDRHPTLKLIVGHMGEFLPMMFKRLDQIFGRFAEAELNRNISAAILEQVWITTSGFFDQAAFLAALTAFGPERILFSVDYPFSDNATAVDFLTHLPASAKDIERIASGNADTLLRLDIV